MVSLSLSLSRLSYLPSNFTTHAVIALLLDHHWNDSTMQLEPARYVFIEAEGHDWHWRSTSSDGSRNITGVSDAHDEFSAQLSRRFHRGKSHRVELWVFGLVQEVLFVRHTIHL
jgi:hypothetical protein